MRPITRPARTGSAGRPGDRTGHDAEGPGPSTLPPSELRPLAGRLGIEDGPASGIAKPVGFAEVCGSVEEGVPAGLGVAGEPVEEGPNGVTPPRPALATGRGWVPPETARRAVLAPPGWAGEGSAKESEGEAPRPDGRLAGNASPVWLTVRSRPSGIRGLSVSRKDTDSKDSGDCADRGTFVSEFTLAAVTLLGPMCPCCPVSSSLPRFTLRTEMSSSPLTFVADNSGPSTGIAADKGSPDGMRVLPASARNDASRDADGLLTAGPTF